MFEIRPFSINDIENVRKFTDQAIGANYYSFEELNNILERSTYQGETYSLLLENLATKTVHGIRITYPPGQWEKGKGKGLRSDLWREPFETVAYFQSLFIDLNLTGQGWGKKMSELAISRLKRTPTKAIVTHSWKESPNDSSGRYLRSLGFELVASHPLYWKDVDYECTRCGINKCLCTAEEMILYI